MKILSHQLAVEVFHEQAQGLKEGGVDLLWLETISAPEEFKAAAEAFSHIGLPWVGTMSFDTAGRTMMGTSPAEMVDLISVYQINQLLSAQTVAFRST